mmetsp:Transcript_12567/g.23198  ORF Transcript_12567/g.23198 Transcript_12567/m.23198 type:complete len:236 (-) Transcript_12567:148-855(-)
MAFGTSGTCICMGAPCHHPAVHEHEEKKPASLMQHIGFPMHEVVPGTSVGRSPGVDATAAAAALVNDAPSTVAGGRARDGDVTDGRSDEADIEAGLQVETTLETPCAGAGGEHRMAALISTGSRTLTVTTPASEQNTYGGSYAQSARSMVRVSSHTSTQEYVAETVELRGPTQEIMTDVGQRGATSWCSRCCVACCCDLCGAVGNICLCVCFAYYSICKRHPKDDLEVRSPEGDP